MRYFILLAIIIIALLFLFQFAENKSLNLSPVPSPVTRHLVLGQQIKSSGCMTAGPLPDQQCTPGAILPTATVEQICTPCYSKSVRNVPTSVKNQVYAEYGITSHKFGEYEVDHLIPLEIGGSNDISNLFPEAANPRPGFHEKDMVENYLHDQVCKGKIDLRVAQEQIAANWLDIYKQIPNPQQYDFNAWKKN